MTLKSRRKHTANKIINSANKNKTIWNTINNKRKNHCLTKKSITIKMKDRVITESQQIGEELNKYLTDIKRPSQDNLPDLQLQGDSKF